MRRRHLLGGAAAAVLTPPNAKSAASHRVAIRLAVGPSPEYTASLTALEQLLATHGWRKGDNVAIDIYWSTGDAQHRRDAIAAVLSAPPDVVLVQSEAVTASVMQAGGRLPVVFLHVADPIASGLVSSLAHPGAG